MQKCSVAIQGLGAVGFPLAEKLLKIGCKVIGTDITKSNCEKARKIGVKIVSPDKILFQEVDILAPCALGGTINKKTIPKLKCKIIAGGANNPLENEIEREAPERRVPELVPCPKNSGGATFLPRLE